MIFAEPQYFYLFLLLIPVTALLHWGYTRRRASQRRYAEVWLLKALKPETSTVHRIARNSMALLALAALIIAMARPQLIREKDVPNEQKGIECILVLDISNSMLAQDLKPDRLGFAKFTMLRLIDNIGPSKIGVVVFAGSAYTHLPITSDHAAARSLISECDPGMMSNQGTAIAPAIDRAIAAFSDRKDVGKAIVIFTDGENHDTDAIGSAKRAAESGAKVFTVALGSTKGAPIPLGEGFMKDHEGKTVLSKANPDFCREMAAAGKGAMLGGANVSALSKHIVDELKKLPQAVMAGNFEEREELFGWFLAVAAIFLLLMQFILFRKNKLFSRLKIFDR